MARGIPRTVINIPLAAGLDTSKDVRAQSPPALDVCRDVIFDELGGLQTRYPYVAIGNNILGGGTISNARKLIVDGDELLCFTATALYSWSVRDTAWVLKATYLAAKIDERPGPSTTGDQINSDRAELSNTVVFAWEDSSKVYVSAHDKTTGAITLAATVVAATSTRPRLLALQTKIMLFVHTGTDAAPVSLVAFALDPTAISSTSFASPTTVLATPNFGSYFDVAAVPTSDTCIVGARRVTTTSYSAIKVTAALAITASTKARTCDGPLAVSVDPTGTDVQVVRGHGTAIEGDLLSVSSLADLFTAQAVGTGSGTINQIACAHRSVQNSSAYRAYVFFSSSESGDGASFTSQSNWVDTAGTVGNAGVAANFVRLLGVASRAFDYNGAVFVWMAFAETSGFTGSGVGSLVGQFQNAYYLYRDDALLIGKAVYNHAGGFSPSTGRLPGVALTSGTTGYSWSATVRRVISTGAGSSGGVDGTGSSFAMRTPQDVAATFDSNDARRTARLGRTLYVTGGEILQYDGTGLYEVGFHYAPFYWDAFTAATGSVADAAYAYKQTYRWLNGVGESERSTSVAIGNVTMTGGPRKFVTSTWFPLTVTHKTSPPPAVENWRTAGNPTSDDPFYLITNKDPSQTSNPNRYVANDPTLALLPTFNDQFADASITTLETNPENGGFLENLAPPPASIIYATDTRIFLAGVPQQPDTIWYSKQRNEGEVAAFNDALVAPVPPLGGDLTAIAFLNETLIVFRERAIYALPGNGYDNTGQGANFGPANQLSSDCGAVNMESVALTPSGLIFKSSKGWYLLTRQFQAQYIGDAVKRFDADTVLSVIVMEDRHEIRCLTNNRLLVYDYKASAWSEHTISDGLDAVVWNGVYHYLTATGPKAEQSSYSSLTYGLDVELAWLKPAELQGQSRLDWVMILGEYRSAFLLRVRMARDYKYTAADTPDWFEDKPWIVSPTTVAGPLQVRFGPSQQQCEAVKLRITAVAELVRSTLLLSTETDVVLTSGTAWSATLRAVDAYPGEYGKNLGLDVAFDAISSGAYSIDVRDHLRYDQTQSLWVESVGTVGVHVKCRVGSSPTVAQLETAIAAATLLCTVSVPDATPSKIIDAALMAGNNASGGFNHGSYTWPTGEAVKLTGIGLEIGQRPPGLYRQLPAAQKV